MAEVAKSKLKLLFLSRIFAKETDESHGISVQEIIEKLAEEGIEELPEGLPHLLTLPLDPTGSGRPQPGGR